VQEQQQHLIYGIYLARLSKTELDIHPHGPYDAL